MRSTDKEGVVVLNSEGVLVKKPEDIFELLSVGQQNRAVAETQQNARSSRSHTIFVLDLL